MNRVVRDRRLTPDEAATHRAVREQVAAELPELLARHHERVADPFAELVAQLRAAREAKGLSLSDLTERTGMDPVAIAGLESGERPAPTVEALSRYAEAVGKRLVVTLADG